MTCAETCGGAPKEGSSSDTVDLATAVGFLDRVCAYASDALRKSAAALKQSTGALTTVHRSIFPSDAPPTAVDALAAPFEEDATTLADFTRTQTVRGSELTFQLILGHQIEGDFEKVVSGFPRRADGRTASLGGVKAQAKQLAVKLVATFERALAKATEAATSRKTRSRSESAAPE